MEGSGICNVVELALVDVSLCVKEGEKHGFGMDPAYVFECISGFDVQLSAAHCSSFCENLKLCSRLEHVVDNGFLMSLTSRILVQNMCE